MGCPSSVTFGKKISFSVCTNDPDTGINTDAYKPPEYKIYDGENQVLVSSGKMVRIDKKSTTGFYTKEIVCSYKNGFRLWGAYSIYIAATVEGCKSATSFSFIVQS
jgi:hypothetical protein